MCAEFESLVSVWLFGWLVGPRRARTLLSRNEASPGACSEDSMTRRPPVLILAFCSAYEIDEVVWRPRPIGPGGQAAFNATLPSRLAWPAHPTHKTKIKKEA